MGTVLFFNILKSYFICVFEPGKEKDSTSRTKKSMSLDSATEEDHKVHVGGGERANLVEGGVSDIKRKVKSTI